MTVTSVDDNSLYVQTVDRGTSPKIETFSGAKSLFQKETARTPSNLVINSETDLEWIPSVKTIIGENSGTQEQILNEINNLKNSTPLGTSTMYDAIVAGARILSDDAVDNSQKTIYVFTDNEANTSLASIQNVVDEVNDIDGDKETEKIRYFLDFDNSELKRVIVEPGLSRDYSGAGATSTIANYVNNQNDPLFIYYDSNYSETGLINEVRLINLQLKINITPERAPRDYWARTDVYLRNLRSNL